MSTRWRHKPHTHTHTHQIVLVFWKYYQRFCCHPHDCDHTAQHSTEIVCVFVFAMSRVLLFKHLIYKWGRQDVNHGTSMKITCCTHRTYTSFAPPSLLGFFSVFVKRHTTGEAVAAATIIRNKIAFANANDTSLRAVYKYMQTHPNTHIHTHSSNPVNSIVFHCFVWQFNPKAQRSSTAKLNCESISWLAHFYASSYWQIACILYSSYIHTHICLFVWNEWDDCEWIHGSYVYVILCLIIQKLNKHNANQFPHTFFTKKFECVQTLDWDFDWDCDWDCVKCW